MPAIADRAVWEKATKGRAGIRWESVVAKSTEGSRRKATRDTVHREVCGVQGRREKEDRNKGKASAKKQAEGGRTLRDIRGVKRNRNEIVTARSNGLRENAETAIVWGTWTCQKEEVYKESRGGGRRYTKVPLWQNSRE